MRKLLIFSALLISLAPTLAVAQRAGPVVDNSRPDNGSSPVPTNALDQYYQRKSMQDLTEEQRQTINKLGPSRPAKKEELTVGAAVNDKTGAPMASIAEVDADGVVVAMGRARVKVPTEAFGHNKAGLLLDLTKAQFEQVIAQAK